MKRIVITMLAVMSLTAVFGQEKTNLAVYVHGSAEENVKKLVAQRIIATMVRSDKYAVVERTAEFLAELKREQGYQYSGNVDDGQIIKLGKQFGVKLVCVADVQQNGSRDYLIAIRMIDIETGLVVSAAGEYNFYDHGISSDWGWFRRAGGEILYSGKNSYTEGLIDITNNIVARLLQGVTTTKGKQKIAIYVTKSSEAYRAKCVSYRLIENITNSGTFITVDRTSDFLAELKYQGSGNVDDSQLSRLGQQFGVNLVCIIDITNVYTTMRIINVETGLIVATAENKKSSKVDEMTEELLQQLTPCTKKDQEITTNKFSRCCEGLTAVNGICRDLTTFCTKKDEKTDSILKCCEGLFNVNGICRDYPCTVHVAAADLPDRYKWKEAMKACLEGWQLPTSSELECMSENYKVIGGFNTDGRYWSSTDYKREALYYRIGSYFMFGSKTDKLLVRCVKDR